MKGCERRHMEFDAMLVFGQPAVGKTTFAKQILSDIMRQRRAEQLIPTMIRVIDLERARSQIEVLETKMDRALDLVTGYLMLYSSATHMELFMLAKKQLRLIIILDGVVRD